jgi:hypothetical protein
MKKRLYMVAVAVAVAGLFAVVVVAPASAAPSVLKPSSKHVNCGPQPVGTVNNFCEALFFQNTSSEPVVVDLITLQGANTSDFAATPSGSPCTEDVAVAPGAFCGLTILFSPVTTGHRSARLFVFPLGSDPARVGIGGRGISPN